MLEAGEADPITADFSPPPTQVSQPQSPETEIDFSNLEFDTWVQLSPKGWSRPD